MAGVGCLQYVLERGQADDWFSSSSIRVCTVVGTIGLVSFIWRELVIPHPVVNLKIMRNRSYAFTTLFTFIAGFGLFTSVFVYPVLTQRVMGYTPLETGLSLLPPTLLGVFLMPVIGTLMGKGVKPAPFIALGFILFAYYSWLSSRMSPDVGRWAFFYPLMIRAFGICLAQLPLINQAVAPLQPKEYPSGIALNNYISHQYAQHRSDLVSGLYDGASAFTNQANAISQGIISKTGDIAGATVKAYQIIDSAVDRQAYYLSYLDTFRLIGLFFPGRAAIYILSESKKACGGRCSRQKSRYGSGTLNNNNMNSQILINMKRMITGLCFVFLLSRAGAQDGPINDPQLKELIRETVANYPKIKELEEQLKLSDVKDELTKTNYLPNISADASYRLCLSHTGR